MAATARKVINRKVRYETELKEQKKQGHAFFPHAMFHDVVVNLLIVLLIVGLAVLWHSTAQPISHAHPNGTVGPLGELYQHKANPAVQATEPRPDWYFLFLFELLRIFKTPWQLIFATIIIPTIMMVLLVALPFLDRGRDRRLSRRPMGVAVGFAVPAVLISLTMAGASAPGVVSGSNISTVAAINQLPGAAIIAGQGGCGSCHKFANGGASTPGKDLTKGSTMFHSDQKAIAAWIGGGAARAGTGMPDFTALGPTKIAELAQVIASLGAGKVVPLQGG